MCIYSVWGRLQVLPLTVIAHGLTRLRCGKVSLDDRKGMKILKEQRGLPERSVIAHIEFT